MLYVIYLITNLINNKKYVGQTKQGREEKRWQEHSIYTVNDNKILHNAIRKYGKENFEFKVVEFNISEALIDEREQYYIKYYNTFYLNGQGYNMTEGGQGIHGYVHTEDTKQRIKESNLTAWQRIKEEEPERYAQLCLNRSLALKGKPKSEAHKAKLSVWASTRTGEKNPFYGKHFTKKSKEKLREAKTKRATFKSINAYELTTGKFWKTFRFTSEAVQELNLAESANTRIWLVCTDKKGHAYGYIWRYKTDFDVDTLPAEIVQQENKTPRAKAVLQYDLENNFITEFESAAAASRALEPDTTKQRKLAKRISSNCLGHVKTVRKYIWKYKDQE
jgi:group I intron endonuclease